MGMNDTPSGERKHIGFFGRRNAGKSSIVNAVAGQRLSLVSDVKGTTTDPVQKAMELLPAGPVVVIDTPGIDDEGELGRLRVERAMRMLDKVDAAVLVVDIADGLLPEDKRLLEELRSRSIPHLIVYNKCDLLPGVPITGENSIAVSAKTGVNIRGLCERIALLLNPEKQERQLIADLIGRDDLIVLVTPIDAAAPKGRMILPQQQVIRAVLDSGAVNVVTRETELASALAMLAKKPKLVITDSQAFGMVSKLVPEDVALTSFSILFARYKGELSDAVRGAAALDTLHDGDKVLISEGCSHHRQCGDIGTVKLPAWLEAYTGKKLAYEWSSGGEFPADLKKYALIVHCGACMLNEREMHARLARAREAGVPITNYGIAIAQAHGILRRALSPFPKMLSLLDGKE